MDKRNVLLINELDFNGCTIDWWIENRKRVNEVIREFNNWQSKDLTNLKMKNVIKAKLDLLILWGKSNSMANWQYELINEMKAHIADLESRIEFTDRAPNTDLIVSETDDGKLVITNRKSGLEITISEFREGLQINFDPSKAQSRESMKGKDPFTVSGSYIFPNT